MRTSLFPTQYVGCLYLCPSFDRGTSQADKTVDDCSHSEIYLVTIEPGRDLSTTTYLATPGNYSNHKSQICAGITQMELFNIIFK